MSPYIAAIMSDLLEALQSGRESGGLLESSKANIEALLASHPEPFERASVEELVAAGDWEELNNRFFRTLAFGTGGLRGKTVGAVVTAAERGTPQAMDRPEFPCTGTNAMNYFNISRATQGLVAYTKEWGQPRSCRTGRASASPTTRGIFPVNSPISRRGSSLTWVATPWCSPSPGRRRS